MTTYIALLRGINVGGNNILPMQELRRLLEDVGCSDVRTYIQSGNAVFRHRAAAAALTRQIRAAIASAKGFDPALLLLKRDALARAAKANPFPEAESDPSKLHLFFLLERPKQPDLEAATQLAAKDERFDLKGTTFYLHAPSGIARSKLATKVDKCLGVAGTGRNWRTVQKLLALASALNDG